MARLTFVLFTVTLVVAVKGFPAFDSNLSTAAAAGNWDEVHRLLAKFYRQINNWQPKSDNPEQLQQLQQESQAAVQEAQQRVQQQLAQQSAQVGGGKPGNGGRLYSEAEYVFHSNDNGVVNSGGRKIINNNGVITQYDFTPEPVLG